MAHGYGETRKRGLSKQKLRIAVAPMTTCGASMPSLVASGHLACSSQQNHER